MFEATNQTVSTKVALNPSFALAAGKVTIHELGQVKPAWEFDATNALSLIAPHIESRIVIATIDQLD